VRPSLSLDEDTFEQVFETSTGSNAPDELDLRNLDFIDPYAMLGLITLGHVHAAAGGAKRTLRLPGREDVLSYLARMDFFRFASRVYAFDRILAVPSREPEGVESDVLLEITAIEKAADIHLIVSRVQKRAETILRTHLGYDDRAIYGFICALSEVCQNIVEHSASTGFVGIQKYRFEKRARRNVVKIAVMDPGVGMKASLSAKLAGKFGPRWSDECAIEQALFRGVSRFDDPGRGLGLTKVREFVQRWGGKMSLRSGTAKMIVFPSPENPQASHTCLADFPGTQVDVILPQRVDEE
jgi:hypothetical protein